MRNETVNARLQLALREVPRGGDGTLTATAISLREDCQLKPLEKRRPTESTDSGFSASAGNSPRADPRLREWPSKAA